MVEIQENLIYLINMNYIKNEVNLLGKKDNVYERFYFIKDLGLKNKNRFVIIKNKKRNEEKIVSFYKLKRGLNPFNVKWFIPEEYIKKEVNIVGLKNHNKFKRFKYVSYFIKNSNRYIIVENLFSKEQKSINLAKLRKGQNPFYKRTLKSWYPEIKETVNRIGKKYSKYEKYEFVKLISRTKQDDFIVRIRNVLDHKEVNTRYFDLKVGRNPFNKKSYLSPLFIKEKVEQLGSKFNKYESFNFVKMNKIKNGKIRVYIENEYYKKTKKVNFDSLCAGVNPFRLFKQKIEENKLNPYILKILINNNINVIKYNNWIDGSRPDFIIKYKKKYYILEAKRDDAKWSSKELKKQIDKYKIIGENNYKEYFEGVYLISLEGRYGVSLEYFLKKILKRKQPF